MNLSAGSRLGPYSIESLLGKGGMGEVWGARDTRLDRAVALKLLPADLALDPGRLARFEREARLLAALNHPGIAALHGLEDLEGRRVLVMERAEGEDLAERLARGPIPVEDAVAIARQIAAALEEAHEKGIVHRDLKPANLKVSGDGTVKVLDFGLAKALAADEDDARSNLSHSPTLTRQGTDAGIILGTAGYMAPEQARGRRVDRRADIWAFGVVLFEMLTGRRLFPGDTVSDTLAAVLRQDIDWAALPATTPASVRTLLHRCLDRDPKERLRDIGEARILLGSTGVGAVAQAPVDVPRRWLPAVSALVAAAGTGLLMWALLPRSARKQSGPVVRSSLRLPEGQRLSRTGASPLALSPDGTRLVYVAQTRDGSRLYVHPLDREEAQPLPGTEDATQPFFSPDGEWVGFAAGGFLKKVNLTGGSPVKIAKAPLPQGASWGTDGRIVFSPTVGSGLWRVSAEGGTPEQLTKPDFGAGGFGHTWPQHLPRSQRILFSVWGRGEGTAILDPTDTTWRVVEPRVLSGAYLATGHLLGLGETYSKVVAVPFDLERLSVTGPLLPILDDASVEANYVTVHAAVSATGTLLYVRRRVRDECSLVWLDRKGQATPIWKRKGLIEAPRVSPDGRFVAFHDEKLRIWSLDAERSVATVLAGGSVNDKDNVGPIWRPDGRRLTFCSSRLGNWDLFEMDASGGEARTLLTRPNDQCPESWAGPGSLLAYVDWDPVTGLDIWLLPEGKDPIPAVRTEWSEHSPTLSPDGRFLAYVSNRSERDQIYVQKVGSVEAVLVSKDGGTEPLWSGDGHELFFRSGDRLISAAIVTNPELRIGASTVLFEAAFDRTSPSGHAYYDVTRDGKRFLAIADSSAVEIQIVTNWFEELKRLAPAIP